MSSASSDDGRASRESKEIFAALAAHAEPGSTLDVERAIAERPELESELRGLHAGWVRLDRLLGSIRVDSSVLESAVRDASIGLEPPDPEMQELLERLRSDPSVRRRYEIRGKIASGGMGDVLRVHDRDLGRDLAMKVARSRSSGARRLRRFLFEARLTARLDHPGIVPVHDIGVDADGRLWFTMPLIRGLTLADILERAGRSDDEARRWSRARILEVILRVCDTLAFAHAAGVVHRDLKPSNVMVGDFGEVYVVDWGLARSADAAEDERDGDVVGTPAYMSPEQARGRSELVGPRADVYSAGAILYHLLAGRMPFAECESGAAVLAALRAGPPTPLEDHAFEAPPELVAICRRAMSRNPEQRYPSVREFAEDLRASMERRVVRAYERGAWPELKKWVSRNRALAIALGAMLGVAVGALGAVSWVQARGKAEVLRLADVRRLEGLEARAEQLWPATPEKTATMERWLDDAGVLLEHLPSHEKTLAEMNDAALASTEGQWQHDVLSGLVRDLSRLRDPDPSQGLIANVRERLDLARTLRSRSLMENAGAWSAAVASIGDVGECPSYGGLLLSPQLGLVPIGRDPRSGLWEFGHVPSGVPPRRAADGSLAFGPESSLVLVLVPGGSFEMGSQPPRSRQPSDARTDPLARENEMPAHAERAAPFFLSKYEMTRAQWRRARGSPADGDAPSDAMLPAGMVSRSEAARVMRHLGLTLPSEIQWECAARATTSTRWWTGYDPQSLIGAENAGSGIDASLPYKDEWPELAPVDALRPNPWGLHHMLGNVAEWTADAYGADDRPGERALAVVRGGSFRSMVRELRAASRAGVPVENRSPEIGVRPARPVE